MVILYTSHIQDITSTLKTKGTVYSSIMIIEDTISNKHAPGKCNVANTTA